VSLSIRKIQCFSQILCIVFLIKSEGQTANGTEKEKIKEKNCIRRLPAFAAIDSKTGIPFPLWTIQLAKANVGRRHPRAVQLLLKTAKMPLRRPNRGSNQG
jgi:hypothetical protein